VLIDEVVRFGPRIRNFAQLPYERVVYDSKATMNAVFLFGLILAGYWLVRLHRRGAVLSNFVFSFEILYIKLSTAADLFLLMSTNPTLPSLSDFSL
jgi:hypothetical protein